MKVERWRNEVGKRLRAAAVACLAAVCVVTMLAGCTSGSSYEPSSKEAVVASPVIGENGVLRVGVDTQNPPLAGTSNSEKIIGLDVDIAAAIADELGLKVSIVDIGSDPEGALKNGKVDIVMGIDESEADGGFWISEAYLPTGIALFATTENAGVPVAGDGSTFAAQISSKSAWAVANEFGENSLSATTSLIDAFHKLGQGEVKYVASDAVIGSYAARGENLDVSIAAMLLMPSGYCVGVSSDNTDLQNHIDSAVSKLVGGGVIDVIEMKWLGMELDLGSVGMTAGVPIKSEPAGTGDSEANGAESGDGSGANDAGDANANNTAAAVSANRP